MIDEFYNKNILVIISAAKHFEKIYQGKHLANEFQGTKSRLQEMQNINC